MGDSWINLGMSYDEHGANNSATYLPAVTNIMQLLAAAVRLDMGLILPNNPYINTALMNETLHTPFPESLDPTGSRWADALNGLGYPDNPATYSFNVFLGGKSAYLNAEYLCRFRYPIPWGESTCYEFSK
jgi:hypothetical protein